VTSSNGASGGLTFEWDNDKAQRNVEKHGVSFEEAESVFEDPNFMMFRDDDHSLPGEERFVSIGLTIRGRLVVVAHTDRGDRIRIISARRARVREEKQYAVR
jgi:uncharacterized DUF497 family protein